MLDVRGRVVELRGREFCVPLGLLFVLGDGDLQKALEEVLQVGRLGGAAVMDLGRQHRVGDGPAVDVAVVSTQNREVVGGGVEDEVLVGERLEKRGRVDDRSVYHVRSALCGFDLNQPHLRYTNVEGLVV